MSDTYLEMIRESCHKRNYIPSGRQLPRTPPLTDPRRHLDFCGEEFDEVQRNPEQAAERGRESNDQNRTFDFNTVEIKTENMPADPNSMLKGMTGYELTQSDLEFIKKMNEEKMIKKLQKDLEEVQRLLKREMMATELVCASREKAQAELNKFPSREEVTEWATVVLKVTSPSADLTDLDAKSLLAMVTKENVQRVVDEKKIEVAQMEKMVANKRRKEAKEREQLEKQITSEQLKLQGLMSQLTDLKSELAQQKEACEALQMQLGTQEAPEVKLETSEELEATKSQVKHRGKERKKAVKFAEKVQDTTNHSKTTRSKRMDNQTNVEDDPANTNTSEALKTKQKSGAAAEKSSKSVKAARGPQRKAEEKESSPQESEQVVRGRRKPPRTTQTTASQPKSQSKVKTGETRSTSQQAAPSRSRQKAAVAADDAGEEAQNVGLRRSKRIASKR